MSSLQSELRAQLKAIEFCPRSTLGQNFLVDEKVLAAIVQAAGVQADECVLEIGAGPGQLTKRLAREAAAVVAVERDTRFRPLYEALPEEVEIVFGDARQLDYAQLVRDRPCRLVSNLPYQGTSELITKALLSLPQARGHTYLLQKEAVERLLARPGSRAYGPLAVLIRLYGRADTPFDVGPSSFWPRPPVTSRLLRLQPEQPLDQETLRRLSLFLKAAFSARRKRLLHNLVGAGYARNQLETVFSSLGVDPLARAESLAPELYLELLRRLTD